MVFNKGAVVYGSGPPQLTPLKIPPFIFKTFSIYLGNSFTARSGSFCASSKKTSRPFSFIYALARRI